MLDINQISKTFNAGTVNEKRALNGLDLHLAEGDFVTVIGGNGAGKSTMLNAIAGTWFVDAGSIMIDGVDVTRLSEHRRAKYLGRVFQDPMTGTAASMQIEENLALAARRGKRRGLKIGITAKERESYKEQGLKSLLTQIQKNAAKYGEQAVIDLMEQCMAANWAGITWDRLMKGGTANGKPDGNAQSERVGHYL